MSGLRIALIVAACLLLAVPALVALAAIPVASVAPLAAGASAAPSASAKPHGVVDGRGPKGWSGFKGGFAFSGPGKGPITIKAINGAQVTLATQDGWTRTINVTSTTVITKGGQAIAVDALDVGDEIRFSQSRNADGSYAIKSIQVPTPRAGGEVSAVDGDKVTVKAKDGSTRVITVTASTVYKVGSKAGAKSDIKVGGAIAAEGTLSGGTFTATAVRITYPHLGGKVTAKTTDSITVTGPRGTTQTIHVTGSTTYMVKGQATGSLGGIAVGDRVEAVGTLRPDGSLDASSVSGRPAKAQHAKDPGASSTPG